jgi:hypothetical protein
MDRQQPEKTSPPVDEYEAASQATAEYDEYSKHAAAYSAPRHRVRKMLIAFGIAVLLAAIGFGVYWLFLKDDGKKAADTQTQNDRPETSQQPANDEISTKTEHYVSNGFMLEFDHPDDWTVTETTGSGQLTVQSPALQFDAATGSSITGRFVFKIRNKQQPLPEFDGGNALAVRESEKIAYTKPSSAQRGSTYLSFLQYATSSDGIDGVYVTGDTGYQVDQAIPKADFTPVDPVISLTFEKCADSACSGEASATGIAESVWQDAAYAKPLKALFQSLIIN